MIKTFTRIFRKDGIEYKARLSVYLDDVASWEEYAYADDWETKGKKMYIDYNGQIYLILYDFEKLDILLKTGKEPDNKNHVLEMPICAN